MNERNINELYELQDFYEEQERREDEEIDYTVHEEPERKFLVQAFDEEHQHVELMTANELINYIDFQDFHSETFWIYEVTEMGRVIPIHYVGWRPNCEISFENDQNEIVLTGYGTDH